MTISESNLKRKIPLKSKLNITTWLYLLSSFIANKVKFRTNEPAFSSSQKSLKISKQIPPQLCLVSKRYVFSLKFNFNKSYQFYPKNSEHFTVTDYNLSETPWVREDHV